MDRNSHNHSHNTRDFDPIAMWLPGVLSRTDNDFICLQLVFYFLRLSILLCVFLWILFNITTIFLVQGNIENA